MDIQKFSGKNIADRLDGTARELYIKVLAYIQEAFGDNVEYEILENQVLYCDQTKDYLYRTPHKTKYILGSRPALEQVVNEVCGGCCSDREKVLALMEYIRDLKEKSGGHDYFLGGCEEELIKKGERYCERVSRLMVALCEIAGIFARMVYHISGGHVTVEVYVEEKWAYIDPRFGLFYLGEDGKMMSVQELMLHPERVFCQPEWVYEYASKEHSVEDMMRQNFELYFSKREILCYATYSLMDANKYHYEWKPSAAFYVETREQKRSELALARCAYMEDDLYKDGVYVV